MDLLTSIQNFQTLGAYLILFTATTFVNKYVLSVLKFTYPTIFQGWQTLVGAIVLRALTLTGRVTVEFSALNRTSLLPWIPGMIFYVLSIYSGSVALSQLAVPVFLCMQNILIPLVLFTEKWQQKREISIEDYLVMAAIVASTLFLTWSDPEFYANFKGAYMWMIIYLCSSGLYILYEVGCADKITLGDMEKIYINYLCSVVVLAPSSYFLGDVFNAKQFEFFYFYKFYVGCVCSGVFGVLLNLASMRLKEKPQGNFGNTRSAALGKLLASALSLGFFEFTITAGTVFWILVNLVTGMLIRDWNDKVPRPSRKEEKDSSKEVQQYDEHNL